MDKGKTIKMITVESSDGKEFSVPEAVMGMQSNVIRHMIEDECTDDPFPLSKVTAQILGMLINYCHKHAEAVPESDTETAGQSSNITPASSRTSEEELKSWDKKFIDVDMGTLYNLMHAADYLAMEGLLQLIIQKVADMIKGKTAEEMRQIFKIKDEFTAEEKEQIHSEFPWVFK